jgi:hypothetical protein
MVGDSTGGQADNSVSADARMTLAHQARSLPVLSTGAFGLSDYEKIVAEGVIL